MVLINRRTLRIEWGQCDPAGIVFYPQYLIIFDTSTGWLFERTGLTPSAMRKKYRIVGMPIVEVGARFVMPCRFDDDIVVESELVSGGAAVLRCGIGFSKPVSWRWTVLRNGFGRPQILNAWARSKRKRCRRKSSRVCPIRPARLL
jgi:acyl-CoA thioesterase FadM